MKHHTRRRQDDHLALKMTPSEQLTPEERERERERERAPAQNNREAKPEQLNFSKTDLLTWT